MEEQTKTAIIAIIIFMIIMTLIGIAIFLIGYADSPENSGDKTITIPNNTAIRIIDGDTLELASGEVVRLICVDAPEIGKKGADESAEFLSSLILNKELRLESDIDNKDNYGRLLRYVYVNFSEGEIFVNKEIVKQGYASVFRYGNDTSKCDEIES